MSSNSQDDINLSNLIPTGHKFDRSMTLGELLYKYGLCHTCLKYLFHFVVLFKHLTEVAIATFYRDQNCKSAFRQPVRSQLGERHYQMDHI